MKRITFLLLLIIASSTIHAQQITQTIRGKVVDIQSQYPLIGANVFVIDSEPFIGITTEIDGTFKLENVPIGRVSLKITSIGYKPATMNNLALSGAKEMVLQISLQEDISSIAEVEIVAKSNKKETLNKMATVSARTISVEEAGKFAGSLNDPSRMAQNYAGVSGASDSRNDIIIRGNSPLGVLWRMEGIDIPSPNHFSTLGATGGPVSMLNLNNLANSDFMTSAWSADYGNALSGVFDLKLRNGNNQKREYLAQMGFNGVELGAEGPFKKGRQASYLINYRYSTLAIFDLLGMDLGLGTAVPQYQDITFKFNFPTKKNGVFTMWGIGGTSFIEFEASGDEADSTNLFSNANESSNFGSQTGVVGMSYKHFFNELTFSELILSASSTNTTGTIDSVGLDESLTNKFGFDKTQVKYAANFKINKKLNKKNTFTLGVIGEDYVTNVIDSAFTHIDPLSASPQYHIISNNKGNGILLQSYINYQHRFSQELTLNAGIHSQHFLLSESNTVEPRLGLKYAVNDRSTLNIGAGIHSQLQPIIIYYVEEEVNNNIEFPNQKLGFSKALHTVLGYDFSFGENMRLKSEVYYQYLYDIPVDTSSSSFSMLNEGAGFSIPNGTGYMNEGTGQNYGAELTLEKFFSQGYYFLVTASVFDSKYKGSDGIERNTAFNSNYVMNVLGGKEFELKKNRTIGFDTKITYSGGKRYTPIDIASSQLYNTEILFTDQKYTQQHKPYFRADLKFTFKVNYKKITSIMSIDLQNFTGQQNIFQTGYNTNTGEIGTVYQRGFFPNFDYKILF